MKTVAERMAKYREKMRAAGLVQKTAWVHPDDWLRIHNDISDAQHRRIKKADDDTT